MLGGGGARSIPPPAPLVTQKGLPPLSSPREPSPHGKPPLPPPPGPLALPRSHSRASSQDRGSEGGALSDFGDTMDSLPGRGSGTGGGGGESKGVKVGKGTRRASNDSDSSLSSLGSLTGGRPVYGEVVDKNVRAAYGFDEEDEEEEEEHVRPATNYGGAISSTAGGMRVWDGKSVVSTTIEVESGPTLLSRGAAKGSLGGYKNPLAEGDED